MTFYLSPPRGEVCVQKMEDYSLSRLQLLLRLTQCADTADQEDVYQDAGIVSHSDCLIAGTVKDAMSHYILRWKLQDSHGFGSLKKLISILYFYFPLKLKVS